MCIAKHHRIGNVIQLYCYRERHWTGDWDSPRWLFASVAVAVAFLLLLRLSLVSNFGCSGGVDCCAGKLGWKGAHAVHERKAGVAPCLISCSLPPLDAALSSSGLSLWIKGCQISFCVNVLRWFARTRTDEWVELGKISDGPPVRETAHQFWHSRAER